MAIYNMWSAIIYEGAHRASAVAHSPGTSAVPGASNQDAP